MVKVISSKTQPSTGWITKPADKVDTGIKSYPSQQTQTSSNTQHQLGTAMGNHTTQVINNVNLNSASLASAMGSHNASILSAVRTQSQQLANALAAINRSKIDNSATLVSAFDRQIEKNSQITRRALDETTKELSRSLDSIASKVDGSLDKFIDARQDIGKELEGFARDFIPDFWGELVNLLVNGSLDLATLLPEDLSANFIASGEYLESRLESFTEVFNKLGNGEYESFDALLSDLFDDEGSKNFADVILVGLGLLPLVLSIFRASLAKEYVAIQHLANRDSTPNIPTWLEVITGMRREIIEIPDAMKMLLDSGWSEDDINFLVHLSANVPNLNEAFEMFRRGLIEEETLDKLITDNGFNQNYVEPFKELVNYVPTAQDVIRFSARDVFDEELAALSGIFEGWDNPEYLKYTKQAGIKDEDARLYWAAHWFLPSVQQGYQMLQRGIIDERELAALFRAADIAPNWREHLLAISYNPITRVDNRRMFISGAINQEQMEDNIRAQGYNEENTQMLSSWYQQQKLESESGGETVRELSQSAIIQAFKAGIYDINQAAQELTNLGYSSTHASTLLLLANSDQALREERDYLDKQRLRNRNVIEKSYMNRLISRNEAKQGFINSGLNQLQSDTLLSMLDTEYQLEYKSNIVQQAQKLYVGYEIDDAELRVMLGRYSFASTEIENIINNLKPLREFRYRDLTTAMINKAVLLDTYDKAWAINQLRGNGYSDSDIEVIGRLEGWWIDVQ